MPSETADQPTVDAAADPAPATEPAAAAPAAEAWVGDPNRYVTVDVQVTKGEGVATVGEFAGSIIGVESNGATVEFSATEAGVGLTELRVALPSVKDGPASVRLTIPAEG